MSEREAAARALWGEIEAAARGHDDHRLWFVWKKNFPARFWRDLGAVGVGALCKQAGLEYTEILRRVTTYDLSLDREAREREEALVAAAQKKMS